MCHHLSKLSQEFLQAQKAINGIVLRNIMGSVTLPLTLAMANLELLYTSKHLIYDFKRNFQGELVPEQPKLLEAEMENLLQLLQQMLEPSSQIH